MTTQAETTHSSSAKRNTKMASSQSINHLLNFTLPPRQTHQYHNLPRRRKTGTQQVWNKERFINAQYRFVMNPNGDYTVHFADPDIYFQWHDILQIIVPRTSPIAAAGSGEHYHSDEGITTCPICLSPPTAPRMTKCGHVFCFPCILHYLNTSDNSKWVRCPICFDSVNERQLKSVKWFDGASDVEEEEEGPPTASSSAAAIESGLVTTPKPGSTLRMRLIQRPQITTLALPRSKTWPSDLLPPHQAPFHFLPDVYSFAKFMLATPSYLIDDLNRDLDDLATERRMLASMGDDLGVNFVDAADAKVRHQIEKATALDTPQLKEAIDSAIQMERQLVDRHVYHQNRQVQEHAANVEESDVPLAYLASHPSGFNTPTHHPARTPLSTQPSTPRAPTPSRNAKPRRNLNPPPPSTSTYYYYQAASGMPIFLHPLDIKILLSHFSGYASFPDSIVVRVESFTLSTVNEDLRKRCKYLAHFPEGADVVFVETDLEGVVGQEGLKNFDRALAMRRSRRREKGKKDDKARARAEEREKEKFLHSWNETTRQHVDAYITPPPPRIPSPVEVEELQQTFQPQATSGAWGPRSFASAATGSQSRPLGQRLPRRPQVAENQADEWDLDAAFHELEQRAGRGSGGGKRKNSNRMVVLGGGGGRRR
ncbi:RING-finger protein MAG2/RNF10 [Abortiporus biennis]